MNEVLCKADTRAVEAILVRELGVEAGQITLEARLEEDLGSDSLALVEIAMAIEDHFHLSIPDERWEQVKTIGDLYELLAESLPQRRR